MKNKEKVRLVRCLLEETASRNIVVEHRGDVGFSMRRRYEGEREDDIIAWTDTLDGLGMYVVIEGRADNDLDVHAAQTACEMVECSYLKRF